MKRSSGWGELGGFGRGMLQRRSSAVHGLSQWTASLPDGQWVELDGGRKAFVRTQSGPPDAVPVLLLHGWTWSMDLNFVDVFPRLADSHPVVALDQRGHGHSPRSASTFDIADLADDAVGVLNALGIQRAVVCGFSLGGIVGLQMALRHPDRVAGLSVQACALSYRQTVRDRLVWPLLRATTILGERPEPTSAIARIYQTYRHDAKFDQRWPWVRTELARTTHSGIVDAGAAVRRHDLRGRVAGLRELPTSMLVTSRDTVCLPWLQHQLADQVGARIVELDEDHLAPITHPEQYAAAAIESIRLAAL